jgi:hypothetical protein
MVCREVVRPHDSVVLPWSIAVRLPPSPIEFGRKLRQPLRISLNRRDPAKLDPLLVELVGHPLPSNP